MSESLSSLRRSMFYVVDTIGVKFNDEFRPTKVSEIDYLPWFALIGQATMRHEI